MVAPRSQADDSPPMADLSTAAVEEHNICLMTGPSDDALDRWLCEILRENPPSATDLLLLASATACGGKQSIASSSVDPQSPAPQTEPSICTARLQLGIQPEEPTPADGANPRLRFIMHRHESCERTLKQLRQHEVPQFLRDIVGRFRVWTANSGARRGDRMSLDHRLRESIELKEMVIKLLEDLNTALQQAVSILRGEASHGDSESSSDASGDEELPAGISGGSIEFPKLKDRLEGCLWEADHIITCLYRFSIAIRNPAPRDKLKKCSKIDMSEFRSFDIALVRHFSDSSIQEYLIERLGNANNTRRQLLEYYNLHHEKIAAPVPQTHIVSEMEEPENRPYEHPQTEPTPVYVGDVTSGSGFIRDAAAAQTTVTTVHGFYRTAVDTQSEAGCTETSYAPTESTSANISETTQMRVPKIPDEEKVDRGEPIQCPYCFQLIDISGPRSWTRHVFEDLRPYVCTFESCHRMGYLFASRHEWFDHEETYHRREWYCKPCNLVSPSHPDFELHLQKHHPGLFGSAAACERPILGPQKCPLCSETYGTPRLRRHLARHMQRLALLVLRSHQHDNASISGSEGIPHSQDTSGLEALTNPSISGEVQELVADKPPPGPSVDTPDELQTEPLQSGTPVGDSEKVAADESSLIHAIETRDAQLVRDLVQAGANVNAFVRQKYGPDKTVLRRAAEIGQMEIVETILDAGADVDSPSEQEYGRTALQVAAAAGHMAMVERFLKANADVNSPAGLEHGRTALQAAAESGHMEVVERLLKAGANANSPPGQEYGRTALQAAAESGHMEVVERLLNAGANVNSSPGPKHGRDALQAAAESGHVEVVERLLEAGADANSSPGDVGGRTALQAATFRGHMKVVEILLKAGTTPLSGVRTREAIENLVQTEIDWNTLLGQLSVIDQDNYQSAMSPFDFNNPNFFWITKNIDFAQWESADAPRALFLSAPFGHGTMEVCSHIIELAKKEARETNGSVLYFFCSSAPKSRCSATLIHTLLSQIICSSSDGRTNSIAAGFLNTLIGGHYQRSPAIWEDDSVDETVRKLLDAPDSELLEALAEAIKKAGIQELLIIIDGLRERAGIGSALFELLTKATPKSKFLLTSQHPLERTPYGMTSIEYDKERKECLRFLRYDDTRYDKISEEHHNSLGWLWEHPQYQEWSQSKTSSLLYIEGKPGSGKSTLAKYFKRKLAEKEPNARSGIVAHYFYTLRGNKLERTHANMLRSLLRSILEQDESCFYLFQREFRNFRRPDISEWPYVSLKKILSSFGVHPSPKPLYLILDAMDESDKNDRGDIMRLLCKLCSKENRCIIKVFLTSRPVAEISNRIQNVIKLQDQNKGDISRFADDFLAQNLGLSGAILHEARDYIVNQAEGVFVWVELVKNELESAEIGYSDAEILDLLKAAPPGMEMFYKEMFRRLENSRPHDVQLGIKLFRLILFSLRPLTLEELRDALAVLDVHNLHYEQFRQNKIRDIRKRIEHCGSGFLETNGTTVQFIHETVREFLFRTIPGASNMKFDMSEEGANRVITNTLVRYLKLFFTSPMMQDFFLKVEGWLPSTYRSYAEYLNEWPLMEYALRHMKEIENRDHQDSGDLEIVATLTQQLTSVPASSFLGTFSSSRLGENRFSALSEDIKYKTLNAATNAPELHHAKRVLLTCTENHIRADGKTPLMISAQKRLPDATRLLLERIADKDARDDNGRTALHYAAENSDEVIARLLVAKGASKHIRDNNRQRPCEVAVDNIQDDKGRPVFGIDFVRDNELPPILRILHPYKEYDD